MDKAGLASAETRFYEPAQQQVQQVIAIELGGIGDSQRRDPFAKVVVADPIAVSPVSGFRPTKNIISPLCGRVTTLGWLTSVRQGWSGFPMRATELIPAPSDQLIPSLLCI